MRSALAVPKRPARYELRAVWKFPHGLCHSQPVPQFDVEPMYERKPDAFGVYEVYGYHVEDFGERAEAQTHADRLNGCDQS